jgi:hypothetical protein
VGAGGAAKKAVGAAKKKLLSAVHPPLFRSPVFHCRHRSATYIADSKNARLVRRAPPDSPPLGFVVCWEGTSKGGGSRIASRRTTSFSPADVFVSTICGWTRRSLEANGFG